MTLCATKITDSEFRELVRNVSRGEYEVSGGEYSGVNGKVTILHRVCGMEWSIRAANFLKKGQRCPRCSTISRRRGSESLDAAVRTVHDGEITPVLEYGRRKEKVFVRHSLCGHEWMASPDTLLNGRGCPVCHPKLVRLSDKEASSRVTLGTGGSVRLVGRSFQGVNKMAEFEDLLCGHHYEANFQSVAESGGSRPNCRRCGKHSKFITSERFASEVSLLGGGEYRLIGTYTDTHEPVEILHEKCGTVYLASRTNFIGSPNRAGRRCPRCSAGNFSSSGQLELLGLIKEALGEENVVERDHSVLDGKRELDIYIPSLSIAFEFDGLYWHSEEGSEGRCGRNYHLEKTLECAEQGIRLVHVFEDEWKQRRRITESKILRLIGASRSLPVMGARSTEIDENVSCREKNSFLLENHIQGPDTGCSLSLGLRGSNGELVAVMTFCAPRRALGKRSQEEGTWELSRFASDIRISCPGGFGKLWSHFRKNYEFSKVYTYADRRWSNGGIYLSNGFELMGESEPNYWYVDQNGRRFHRYGLRKQKLRSMFPDIYEDRKTERQITREAGYLTIWDCGCTSFGFIQE
jgi:hypothetical protein